MNTALRQAAMPQHRSRSRGNRPYPKRPYSDQQPRRKFLHLAAGAAALPAVSRIATAQSYPTRPMIVPVAAGGSADAVARILAERMRQSLKQPIIIDNVSGARAGRMATRLTLVSLRTMC
jgi:hypothetical protein